MKFKLTQNRDESETSVSPEQAKFVSLLKLSINQKFAEVLAGKKDNSSDKTEESKKQKDVDQAFITLLDATTITNYVRGIFVKKLNLVPPQVEAALTLSEATVAPSTIEKIKLIKRAIGLVGGLTGIGAIATAILIALGVGTAATAPAIWATIVTFFTGTAASTPFLGPLALGLGGAGVAAIAVYFSASGNSAERAEKFKKALLHSCEKAVNQIWKEYGDQLS